ncbi:MULTISPECIES: anti-sigma factor [unclassified Streptomyces]|uniref:anti-sigma factor n=1 Tax=Streptomyces TaxID=1883 RepID=UPI0001C1BB0E|nr:MULTISPECIES: anti-sigma factor [unclassified Streptomyces]AEN08976.1 Anti-sigma K factor RskA [Streptomyces sp. SirexAA-E]MYR69028.1 anti-sigma factor [Streptomyces sp. SID4939]MYS00456.1 anti-sigma factor [Streptomyces sp. SID4940]MYT62638.1 anti-sigma factor [Streptomyces sp. SID8357]MYT86205.1 anti-sigma factor [Streptomyces sp. SID8360]
MSTAELHTLTGAYALHALPEDERLSFERHLGACEACAQEVRELSATAARLGLAVSATAPGAMRARVLREITTVRQEPPSHGRISRAGAARGRAGRWTTYALAACVAAAAALGGVAVWQNQLAQDARQEARQAREHNTQLSRVLAAPDARTVSAALEGGARGTVVVSQSENRAVFAASGLARPPGGKVYQLWFDDGGTMRSAGLVEASDTDEAVLMDGPVDRASGMGITVEPAGGSARPTTQPLGLMGFPAA